MDFESPPPIGGDLGGFNYHEHKPILTHRLL